MSKPTVLLDIDNTILDISAVKKQISMVIDDNYGQGANEKFWEVYEGIRSEAGHVDAKEIAMRFAKLLNSPDYASAIAAFVEVAFENYLLPGAKELIEFLGSSTNMVVFSDGGELFQGAKVKRLGLDQVAREVIISQSKKDLFGEIALRYPGEIIVIDDKPEILSKAKEAIGACKTVWVKFGRYAEGVDSVGADFETENLLEIKNYIEKLRN